MRRGSVRGGPGGLRNPHAPRGRPAAAAVSAGQRPCLGGGAGARQGRARSVCRAIFSRAGSRRGRPAASGWFPPPPAPPPRARRSPAGAALSGAAPRLRGAAATPPPRPAPRRGGRRARGVWCKVKGPPAACAGPAGAAAASLGTVLPKSSRDSESEKSLSGFETTAAYSLEDSMDSKDTITSSVSEEKVCGSGEALSNGIKKHRTSLPSPMFSRNDFSIWSILRKCIGMELSKITMPVIFNEPLSFLQRLTEYMEHTYLIHKASSLSSTTERMQCVAAFAVSAVASQWERTGKPFNPLLGETYELIRDDLGFRLLSEQVSHHPPISAFYAEGLNNDFVFHGSIYPKLKFWGKSVEAEPKGTMTLELLEHNEAYTWTNPTCCVHNIIVGKLWIEQYGNVEITNHKTGEKCVLSFKPCGLFGKELHKVEGYIQDKSKKKLCALYGKWTECLYSVDPATFDAYKKNDKKNTEEKKSSKQVGNTEESDEMPLPDSESVYVIPGSVLLWKITPRPPNSAQMYNFTSFAMALNELDKEMESVIPKTDCRLRPDIRAMENGEIDLASEEKKRLEEKQRTARKNRSKSEEDWKTRWFHQGPNPHTGTQDWLYSGNYWDRNYFNLPDIY
ncbi:oxysterol-binding protein-related protein 1 isoform X3 [Prinia subflava]|uniref:oxysterol-binding protein-related protein 1 isoform X3 n=1 Tax=Prinia subflava TaxID=208062 RepID=UPI002FE28551